MALILPALLMALTLVSYTHATAEDSGDIARMKTQLDLLTRRISFLATFKASDLLYGGGKTVIFDSVVANTGNAYNPTTGVFTAPYRGDYVFAYQPFTHGAADANWDLYINGQMALRGRSPNSHDTGNESVLPVTLQAGDRVYVYCRDDLPIWGLNHSFFAGWLVKAF